MSSISQSLQLGTVTWQPAFDHPDLLAPSTHALIGQWIEEDPEVYHRIVVCAIDPELSDTAVMSEHYQIPMFNSVNCVLVGGKREGQERTAAVAVRATTRADINGTIKKMLDVRKASFVPMDRAVAESGMQYGGITPIGLPASWRFVMDQDALEGPIVIGSGLRESKIALPGHLLAQLTGAEVISDLGRSGVAA